MCQAPKITKAAAKAAEKAALANAQQIEGDAHEMLFAGTADNVDVGDDDWKLSPEEADLGRAVSAEEVNSLSSSGHG